MLPDFVLGVILFVVIIFIAFSLANFWVSWLYDQEFDPFLLFPLLLLLIFVPCFTDPMKIETLEKKVTLVDGRKIIVFNGVIHDVTNENIDDAAVIMYTPKFSKFCYGMFYCAGVSYWGVIDKTSKVLEEK